ncbi:helix-turn-helix domain-containing protein [Vagococcus hydrophili]|uniref:Helicase Helix-turn-helix domain-containing protein n=1 Tax=Vagococcus hydrophili TaxID=2714947 RepID=A0A6G8AWP0_9ENTE|nr:helix-turn-helix domain-containing protein [Vagococcus hydrophili]QIL49365.1 hypothetical protein G7082_13095 [Vagococcus hydrophili]
MTYYHHFILHCFESKQPMRVSTLYHLLKGKRTTSILSYAYFYDLLEYFNLFSKQQESSYLKTIQELIQNGYLEVLEEGVVQITDEGLLLLINQKAKPNLSSLNQLKYYKWDLKYWQRLLFVTQVISEKSFKEKNYVPIENNVFRQQQLKRWLKKQDEKIIENIYDEWRFIADQLPKDDQIYIFKQLVGHEHVGQTFQQITENQETDLIFSYLEFKNILHEMIELIEEFQDKLPIFFGMMGEEKQLLKEESYLVTKKIYEKTQSVREVAQVRNLKESTITDHLLESFLISTSKEEIILNESLNRQILDKFRVEQPDFRRWRFSDVRKEMPNLSFYEFKMYQFFLVEQEKVL